jgi:rubrerythrin
LTTPTLDRAMSRQEILGAVLAAEREAHDLLEQAARLTPDPAEQDLYRRLAAKEQQALDELSQEEDRLAAERFVEDALDV